MIEPSTLRRALEEKDRVYNALILRHIMGRYGRGNIGFLWTFIEPMLLCVGVMAIWSLTKGGVEHGVQLTAVVFTGYMPLTLWRHMTNSMGHVMRSSKFLMNYRMISQYDVILARLFIEFFSTSGAALFVYIVLNTFGILPDVYDWSRVILGWLIMGALGFGGGALMAGITEANEVVEKFIPAFQYLMLPFSGCFFMLSWLPDSSREALLYVPFPHAFETIRAGFFGPGVMTYSSPSYGFAWALFLAGCGFLIIRMVRDHIEG
ncbi:capsular polysaccharide transport system permease protein [Bosea sp. OK403]|nr:ABC transporter permease [Bosea sp. OK403]SFJ54975.1 capsular polysaccharide transport system permease protein [Bosea sp. OK403]